VPEFSAHVSLEYPWLSQSDIKDFFTCKLKFKLNKLDRRAFTHSFDYVMRGNEYHLIFHGFFQEVDLDKVVELGSSMRVLDDPGESKACQYFRDVCWGLANKGYIIEYKEKPYLYDMNIEGFCRFEASCLIEVMRNKGRLSKAMLKKYWVPQEMESYIKDDGLQVYGTVDEWLLDFDGNPYILDFKTGKPKSGTRTDPKTGELKKAQLHFPANMQLWMYTYLLSKKLGCQWKGMLAMLVYTKGDDPGVITLNIKKASMEGFSTRLNEIREHVKAKKPYTPAFVEHPEAKLFVCLYCPYQGLCHSPEDLLLFEERRMADGN
jgi:hypothetical protein